MIEMVVATRNRHKLEEIQAVLGAMFHCRSIDQLEGAPALIEDGSTFAENATRKAVQLAEWLARIPHPASRIPHPESFVLADDSGLEVDILNGAPGVHSARFAAADAGAAGNSPDEANNARLLRLLKDVPFERRTARFRCVLALTPVVAPAAANASPVCYTNDPELRTELFEGVCEGRIDLAPRGNGGFGYDPLFIPVGYQRSFAELGSGLKNQFSHRARALAKVRDRFAGPPVQR